MFAAQQRLFGRVEFVRATLRLRGQKVELAVARKTPDRAFTDDNRLIPFLESRTQTALKARDMPEQPFAALIERLIVLLSTSRQLGKEVERINGEIQDLSRLISAKEKRAPPTVYASSARFTRFSTRTF